MEQVEFEKAAKIKSKIDSYKSKLYQLKEMKDAKTLSLNIVSSDFDPLKPKVTELYLLKDNNNPNSLRYSLDTILENTMDFLRQEIRNAEKEFLEL